MSYYLLWPAADTLYSHITTAFNEIVLPVSYLLFVAIELAKPQISARRLCSRVLWRKGPPSYVQVTKVKFSLVPFNSHFLSPLHNGPVSYFGCAGSDLQLGDFYHDTLTLPVENEKNGGRCHCVVCLLAKTHKCHISELKVYCSSAFHVTSAVDSSYQINKH